MELRNRNRWLALAVAAMLVGCSDEETAETVAPTGELSPLAAYIPANTAYLGANLQPLPDPVVDRFWDMAEPFLEIARKEAARARTKLEASTELTDDERLGLAVLRELDGKLDRNGIESLGISGDYFALYANGVLPVIRVHLSDGAALRAAIDRIAADAGATFDQKEVGGRPYFDFGDEEIRVVASPQDDQLLVTFVPAGADATAIIESVVSAKPAGDGGRDRLTAINREFGLSPHGTVLVDFPALVDAVFQDSSAMATALFAQHRSEVSPACQQELRAIAQVAPRLVSGYTELNASRIEQLMVWELRDDLATELQGITVPMRGLVPNDEGAAYFAFGLDLMKLKTFAQNRVTAMQAEPWQCEWFTQANANLDRAAQQLSQPLPPIVGNFQGLRVLVDEVDLDATTTGGQPKVSGLVSLGVTNPQLLLGMAGAFVPQLSQLQLTPDGNPVALPADLVPSPAVESPFIAMMNHGLAISVGSGLEQRLKGFLDAPAPEGPAPLMVFSYDPAVFGDLQAQAMGQSMAGYEARVTEEGDAEQAAAAAETQRELQAAMTRYYQSMGRASGQVHLSERGIEMTGVTTFR